MLKSLRSCYKHFIKDEFPEYPELLLEAISISRRLQDPLMEFCALFASPEEEIYSLKMHILQVCTWTATTR